MKRKLDHLDKVITDWFRNHGYNVLRWSLAIVFIWFGLLKLLGVSPANELVTNTVYWFNPSWFVPLLGWWEVLIGLCIIYKPLIRLGIFLMALQMVGTFLPLILLPKIMYTGGIGLTLEAQYIIKNIVLIGAGMIVASHARDKN